MKKRFVNIYKDDIGFFVSNEAHETFEAAFENRDRLSAYLETVELISFPELQDKLLKDEKCARGYSNERKEKL